MRVDQNRRYGYPPVQLAGRVFVAAVFDRGCRTWVPIGMFFFGLVTPFTMAAASEWPSAGPFTIVESSDACAAHADFPFAGRSDVRFAVVSAGGRVGYAFHSLDWTKPPQATEVTLNFLGRGGDVSASFKGPVRPNTYASVYDGFVASLDEGSLDDFASAHSLMVERDGSVITHINLEGSARATTVLRQCFDSVRRRVRAESEAAKTWDYIEKDPFEVRPSSEPGVTAGQWSRPPRPIDQDIPQRLLDRGGKGSATVDCMVDDWGRTRECHVTSEDPEGYGVGAAAIRVVSRAQAAPRMVGQRIQARVDFSVD